MYFTEQLNDHLYDNGDLKGLNEFGAEACGI
jgi:hypothetical protein